MSNVCFYLVALALRLPLPQDAEYWLLDVIDRQACTTRRR